MTGATVKRFLPGATPFTYTIFFENLPTATAAAQVVTITDQLDTANLDLNTFSFGAVSFDKYTVTPPPGKSEFVAALDLRPASNLIVKIDARLDRNTGVLTWRFTSLDPETQQPTDDPDAGFLAPNRTSPEGEGSVTFFVSPKSGLATNTEIRNKARIVFDVNAPIDTPEWLNTIDNAPPASRVQTLPPRQNTQSFTVNWAGTDAGAGINSYSVYVSQNGGPFTPFLTDTPLTSATFNGALGSTYAFYSVASDLAGNVEPAKTAAEATTTLAATPNVQFSAANYSVGEGDGRVSVTVTRTGDTTAAASVNYQTADADTFTVGCADAVGAGGAAYGRCDFSTTFGTLSFAAGETAKTITVPLINDGHVEGPETFQLRLSNPTGAALGVISTATVTITANDTAGTPNPIITLSPSDFPFFVRQQYLDFLSREPEASEPWTAVMNRCANVNTGPATNTDCDRIAVSGAFFGSPEFSLKGFYVFRFYKLAFNRLPQYTEITSDMSFVAGATAAEVYARKTQLATAFVARPEFQAAYGALSNADYVQALMARAGRSQITTFDPVNPDGTAKVTLTSVELINKLNNNALTRAQVLRAIADSDEVGAAEYNNAFVAVQYYGYLRRTPDDSGYQAWLRVINQDPNNVRIMINGFMNSTEYRMRFGQP